MEYPEKTPETEKLSVNDFQENYSTGFIKLYRSIRKHWIHENPLYFRAWCDILMEVNHKGKKTLIDGELIECKRGEAVYSIKSWIKIFGREWSRQKVRTFFELLERDSMIVTIGLRKTTKLTVVNYDTYQDIPTNKEPRDNQEITKRQPQLKNDKNDKNKRDALKGANGDFHKMQNWIWETLPHVSKIEKQLTYDECERLIDDYSRDVLLDVLEAMENTKGVEKKYTSVNKTVRNWANRRKNSDNGKHDPIEDEIKRTWGRSD